MWMIDRFVGNIFGGDDGGGVDLQKHSLWRDVLVFRRRVRVGRIVGVVGAWLLGL
jgi:hypothetical protein